MNGLLLKKVPAHKLLLSFVLFFAASMAQALSTDKDQPIEVESDTAELDDINNISIYTGNVIVVRGSILMTGDKMTVYHTENDELDTLIMIGQPATYRQMPDGGTVYDEAEALTIEYYELKNLAILIDEAIVTQEGLRLTGDRIDYDTETSQVKAKTNTTTTLKKSTPKPGERVKLILKNKKPAEEQPSTSGDK